MIYHILKAQLPEEPTADEPNACQIVFRLPGSGERVQRRFHKDQTVSVMYLFIDSISDQIQFENSNKYVIMQSMPRKEYRDKEKTFGEVGLFPRAMLQVKEED